MLKTTVLNNVFLVDSVEDMANIRAGFDTDIYHMDNLVIHVHRVNNDVYGNPLYHVTIFNSDYVNITPELKGCPSVYRVYKKRGYATVQSYNIGQSLSRIVKFLANLD